MTTYRVDGMTCEGCVKSVRAAINEALPATEISVDLAASTVTVDDATDQEQLRAAVEAAGFDFNGAAE